MSLVPHTVFPRSNFDMDLWNRQFDWGPRALDVFDPFDNLDMQMKNSMNWLSKPDWNMNMQNVPQKYRITFDCNGYNPNSIKCEIHDDKLIVTGHEGNPHKKEDEEYNLREFKKTWKLPKDLDCDKMVSFMTPNGWLVVEIPMMMKNNMMEKEFFPTIMDTKHGKEVNMKLCLPEHIDPSELTITAKDRDVIIKGQHKEDKHSGNSNSHSEVYYYRRSTMPENTDMNHLKCTLGDSNQLMLEAPIMCKKAPNNAIEGHKPKKALLSG
jgi:HSP20 family molecular chaperone IbpA